MLYSLAKTVMLQQSYQIYYHVIVNMLGQWESFRGQAPKPQYCFILLFSNLKAIGVSLRNLAQ